MHTLSMLHMAGYNVFDTQAMKTVELLDFLGVFSHGGILVGSHAYAAIGNNLGVSWHDGMGADDVDVSHNISIVQNTHAISLRKSLLKAGFEPVYGLNHKYAPLSVR